MLNSTAIHNSNFTWRIFFFFMLILFLESMHTYLFWSIPYVIPLIVASFSILFLVANPNYFSFKKQNIIPVLLFYITFLYTIRDQNINGFIGGILPFISVFLIFSLKTMYKAKFLEMLTKTLSKILVISLSVWILVKFDVPMPNTTITYLGGKTTYILNNYYVYIEYTGVLASMRFMSIFIEPGYLGALLAILIYVNNFELKRKEILIMFLVLFLTFSIAGYIMIAFAYISYLLKNMRYGIVYLLLAVFILNLSYNYFIEFNNGNNTINDLVVKRLTINDEGTISGYNRTSKNMNVMFDNFLKSKDILTGIGVRYVEFGGGVGFKPFFIINGIVGLLLLLLSYISAWFYNKRLFSLTISILFIMIFIKGHSEIFWAGYLMVYATSMYLPENWRDVYNLKREH